MLCVALLLAGCTNLGYYAQAVDGHFKIMRSAHPIQEILQDSATDTGLRKKLEEVYAVREFASRELALPDNKSYRSYADLGQPFVVWNVFAAPQLSVGLEKWCMIFIGCVNYRGYFDRAEAERYASELRNQGLDTYVGGVTAYSTLGFFNDPVLNTFLQLGNMETAHIIFHELSHQLLYVNDDTEFNESFATTVENEGMLRWLAHAANPAQQQAYTVRQQRKLLFAQLVARYREKLRALYATPQTADEKQRTKTKIMADLRQDYIELKADWGGDTSYDKWFAQDLNNAKLASFTLYTQLVPAFEALLAQEGHNLPRFYRRVSELARLSKAERTAALEPEKSI
jgi:predicted aminopeptidase